MECNYTSFFFIRMKASDLDVAIIEDASKKSIAANM